MSTNTENIEECPETITSHIYAWWAKKEIGHSNPNIDEYAKLIVNEFTKLKNGEIDLKQFEDNTPNINDETPLNYIRNCILIHYPN